MSYNHHTKVKGDVGVGCVVAEILKHEMQIALTLSEHLPFDVIAIVEGRKLYRVSIKYVAARNEKIEIDLRSSWADKNGTHTIQFDPDSCDIIAAYCPDTGKCYFLPATMVSKTGRIYLYLSRPKRSYQPVVLIADDFLNPLKAVTEESV